MALVFSLIKLRVRIHTVLNNIFMIFGSYEISQMISQSTTLSGIGRNDDFTANHGLPTFLSAFVDDS